MMNSGNVNWEDVFRQVGGDAANWAQQAVRLKAAADTARWALFRASNHPEDISDILNARFMNPRELNGALVGAYLMLSGMALENMCKAIYIAHSPNDAIEVDSRSGRLRLSRVLKTHNLTSLVTTCIQFANECADNDVHRTGLSQDESRLLARLKDFIEWGGRYVIPTTREKYEQAASDDLMRHHTDDERDLVNSLFQWLFSAFWAVSRECHNPSFGCI